MSTYTLSIFEEVEYEITVEAESDEHAERKALERFLQQRSTARDSLFVACRNREIGIIKRKK